MTGLAVLLAVVAVLLAVAGPRASSLRRLRAGPPVEADGRPWPRRLGLVLLVSAALPAAGVAGGPRVVVLTAAALLGLGTAGHLLALRRHRSRAEGSQRDVAEAAAVLAANLRTGMVPASALAAAAASCPVLEDARATMALGGEVTEVWRRQAEREGCGGLRALARGWQVAAGSGASLTGTLEQVADGLADDQSLQAVVGSELAAPRATGLLMAFLPAIGVGMGYLIGGNPLGWLTAGPAGWACLLLGVALACAGVLWIENLARRAAAQG